jgi:hypothetical protein
LTQAIFPDISSFLGPAFFKSPVSLGMALDQTGQLAFYNASSASQTIFQAGNATADVTYTWPTAAPGTSGALLSSTTAGVLSWSLTPTLTSITVTTLTATTGLFGDGTVGSPSIAFNSDNDGTGTGFYRVGANQIGVATNGVLRLQIDSTAVANYDSVFRAIGQASATFPDYSFINDTNTGFRATGADAIALTTGGADYLTISSAGQVALGSGTAATNVRINSQTATGVNTATMTNSPTTGNPAVWIVVNINGTDRKIPAWA